MSSFADGTRLNPHPSLMLVTCLQPVIGYDSASKVAKLAHKEGLTLKEAAMKLQVLSDKEYDRHVRPEKMIAPHARPSLAST